MIKSEDDETRDKQAFVLVSRLEHASAQQAQHHLSANDAPSPIPGQLTVSSISCGVCTDAAMQKLVKDKISLKAWLAAAAAAAAQGLLHLMLHLL